MIKEPGARLVGVRLTPANIRKLNLMTKLAWQSRSEAMNLLLARLDLSHWPDLWLNPVVVTPDTVEETADVAG